MDMQKQIIVCGDFDDIRSRHLRFLEEAARLGELNVLVWPDEAIQRRTGRPPKFPWPSGCIFSMRSATWRGSCRWPRRPTPGHPELLTIKAATLIKAADVIVYDRLVQEDVLALAKPGAERIYMGKPVGRHDSRQDEVNELLVHKAREGKAVVRLKGGDPFLFGRGGEEAEYLAEHGVAFDVIPGVSSALSAPLSAGIPVTHRDASSAVAIVTGHFREGDDDEVDFNALSKIPTVVFLMGVHAVEQIARRLIREGRDADTPAAIIQMAFWHGEQVVTGTLETIAEEAKLHGIKAPATLVIGEVVRLREKLKKAERELQRRGEPDARFAPGPSPQELFRLATAGVGSQMLAWAVSAGVFEALEHPKTVYNLAHPNPCRCGRVVRHDAGAGRAWTGGGAAGRLS